jgi:hypothetical protein
MRVAVDARRRTVGGPSGVGNAGVWIKHLGEIEVLLIDELLQRSDLADLLDSEDLILLVAVDSQTGRVVAAVLKTCKT